MQPFIFYILLFTGWALGLKTVPGRVFDRFMTVWLQSQDYEDVIEDPSFTDLRSEGILLTRYYGLSHPAQPNYVGAIGGDYFGLNHDRFIRVPKNVSTIGDLLDFRRVSWKGYLEDMPGPGYMGRASDGSTGNGGWDYLRGHNPFISFDSINMNNTRLFNMESFRAFTRDFTQNAVPQFVFVVPNVMHGGQNSSLGYAAAWASWFLRPLLDDKSFMNRTLVLLTYDQSGQGNRLEYDNLVSMNSSRSNNHNTTSNPNHVAALLLGGAVPPSLRGTEDDTLYTHYSISATAQNNWVLPSLGRFDVGANVFRLVANITGYKNREPPRAANITNAVSYPGVFFENNSVPSDSDINPRTPLPPPNLKLKGAGGLPVLDIVKAHWTKTRREKSPYDGSGQVYNGEWNLPVFKKQSRNRQLR